MTAELHTEAAPFPVGNGHRRNRQAFSERTVFVFGIFFCFHRTPPEAKKEIKVSAEIDPADTCFFTEA